MDSIGNETQEQYDRRNERHHDRDEDVADQERFLAWHRAPRLSRVPRKPKPKEEPRES